MVTSAGISAKKAWHISVNLLVLLCVVLMMNTAQAQQQIEVTPEQIPGTFRDISSIFITPTPNIIVVERGNNRILRVGIDGTRKDSLGRLGSGNYQFDQPLDVDATNELKIYVSDYSNGRIQVFDRRLQYLSTIRLPRMGNMRDYQPTYLAVNNLGEVYFYDELNEYIYKFNFNGSFEQRFSTRGDDEIRKPVGMAFIDDTIFIADRDKQIVHFMSANGRYLGFIAGFKNLTALSTWNNQIFIADGNKIIVYDIFGRNAGEYIVKNLSDIRSFGVYRDHIILTDGSHIYKMKRIAFEE